MSRFLIPAASSLVLALGVTGCAGASRKPVPDVRRETLKVAEDTLDAAGLHSRTASGGLFGIIVRANWTVCRQDPPPHRVASSVLLTVARAREVPDVIGESLGGAEDAFDDLGVRVRDVSLDEGPVFDESLWTVCEQDPRAGSALEPTVELYVSHACACGGYSS